MPKTHDAYKEKLRAAGLKTTPKRLQVLAALDAADKPMAALDLLEDKLSDMDMVTVYRTLESFVNAGIVRSVDLRHGHADYELVREGEHHHHVVCESCGAIEDIAECPAPAFETRVLKDTKKFAKFTDHALELFGICTACIKTV